MAAPENSTPIFTSDFFYLADPASLYPSIIISRNINPSESLMRDEEGRELRIFSDPPWTDEEGQCCD